MRDKLNKSIEQCQAHLANPKLSEMSRQRNETYLEIFLSYKRLLNVISDEMTPATKPCYRYGGRVIQDCEVCESCLKPEDLAYSEGEE